MSILLSAEMEVDGDLKVTGTVDANGNPITNVGAPQTLTDAVNAGILQSALTDDGVYEYSFIVMFNNDMDDEYLDALNYHNFRVINSEGIGSQQGFFSFHGTLSGLLNEGWKLKKSLSKVISNRRIDDLYNFAIKNGALGGKLLGAGGGGFMLIYMPHYKQKKFLKKIKNEISVPFNFTNQGSEIILNN